MGTAAAVLPFFPTRGESVRLEFPCIFSHPLTRPSFVSVFVKGNQLDRCDRIGIVFILSSEHPLSPVALDHPAADILEQGGICRIDF